MYNMSWTEVIQNAATSPLCTHLNLSCNGSHQRWPTPPPSLSQIPDTACSSESRQKQKIRIRPAAQSKQHTSSGPSSREDNIRHPSAVTEWCARLNEVSWQILPERTKLFFTSVVMTRQEAVGLMVTSPVINPTSWNSSYISLYFWLDSALIGLVKITLCFSLRARAMAYLQERQSKLQMLHRDKELTTLISYSCVWIKYGGYDWWMPVHEFDCEFRESFSCN